MSDVPQRHGITVPFPGLALHEQREMYEEVASLGYTDLWSAESGALDAFTPLALAAAWTPTLRLGTAIVPVFTRGAATLAASVAAMCSAAPGRFAIGVGTSSPVIVENWNGIPFDKPYQRVRDTVRFLRAALSGEQRHRGLRDLLGEGLPPRRRGRPDAADPRGRSAAGDAAARRPRGRRCDHQLALARRRAHGRGARRRRQGDRGPHLRPADGGPRRRARRRAALDRRVPERPRVREVPRVARPRRRPAADVGRVERRATARPRPRRSPTR